MNKSLELIFVPIDNRGEDDIIILGINTQGFVSCAKIKLQ
ncbi:MAG: hypothetical protein ACI97N_001245 [Cognaticolwellia sp.]|jgi:hypothetical protein